MKITQILEGKPFMTEFGIVGYSSVILVQEEEKNILYDCGSKGCALQLKAGLKEQGVLPEDITHVVVSHMHFDHVGNLPLFCNAEILMNKVEWDYANETPDEWDCVATCDYIKHHCSLKFISEGTKLTGSVRVMELPGHTAGMIGLKCGDDVILCSDAIKNRYEMWEDMPLMSIDVQKSIASRKRIQEEARYIYTGHDVMLDIHQPVNREAIHFNIRFANGTEKSL